MEQQTCYNFSKSLMTLDILDNIVKQRIIAFQQLLFCVPDILDRKSVV